MGEEDDEWRSRVNRDENREELCVSKRGAPERRRTARAKSIINHLELSTKTRRRAKTDRARIVRARQHDRDALRERSALRGRGRHER
jgi:hypothetical protein